MKVRAHMFFVLLLPLLYASGGLAAEQDFFALLESMVAKDLNLSAEESLNRSELRSFDADRHSSQPTLRASLIQSMHKEWQDNDYPSGAYWQAELGLNLYRFGQDAARYRLAERGEGRYASARQRQVLESENIAAEKILAFIYYSQDQAVLEKILKVRQRLLDVASNQYGKGLLPQQEVKKVEIDLRSISLQIKRAGVQVEQARIELERYLGPVSLSPLWPFRGGAEALVALNMTGVHPLFSEAKETLAMEEERSKILWAAQYPSLDAQVIANRSLNGQPFNAGQTDLLLSVSVPILDQGVSRSLYRAQSERFAAARQRLDWLTQNIDVQKRAAAVALKESVSNIAVYEDLITTSRELYQGSLARFERGLISVNDLGVDEARFYNAERDRVQSWYNLHRSWLSMCQSLGLRLNDCHGHAAT